MRFSPSRLGIHSRDCLACHTDAPFPRQRPLDCLSIQCTVGPLVLFQVCSLLSMLSFDESIVHPDASNDNQDN